MPETRALTDALSKATVAAYGVVKFAESGEATAGEAVQSTDSRLSDSRAPSGDAGGVLSGSYPNPGFATPMATAASVTAVADNLATHVGTMATSGVAGHVTLEGVQDLVAAMFPQAEFEYDDDTGIISVTFPEGGGAGITDGYLDFPEQGTAPATPADLIRRMYANSDGIALLDESGVPLQVALLGRTTLQTWVGPQRLLAQLDIQTGVIALLIGADSSLTTRTDATTKIGRYGLVHYMNAEEPVALLFGSSTATDNNVFIGGATSSMNAATKIFIYTGATTTTTSGVRRMTVDKDGNIGMGPSDPVALVDVHQATGGIITLRRSVDTSVALGEMLGKIQWWSMDSDLAAGFNIAADIEVQAAQHHQATNKGAGRMIFRTTPFVDNAVPVERLRIDENGRLGIGVTSPTAFLHLPAGLVDANGAPLKFAAGSLLTTPEAGTVEFDGTSFFMSLAAGSGGRYTVPLLERLTTQTWAGPQAYSGGATYDSTAATVFHVRGSATGAAQTAFVIQSSTTGTPANGFGSLMRFQAMSSGNPVPTGLSNQGIITARWEDGAYATRRGAFEFRVYDVSATPVPLYLSAHANGSINVGTGTAPTARLQLPAGAAAANSGPLKLTAGVNLTTPEAGVLEYDGTNLYFTPTAGNRRVVQLSAAATPRIYAWYDKDTPAAAQTYGPVYTTDVATTYVGIVGDTQVIPTGTNAVATIRYKEPDGAWADLVTATFTAGGSDTPTGGTPTDTSFPAGTKFMRLWTTPSNIAQVTVQLNLAVA